MARFQKKRANLTDLFIFGCVAFDTAKNRRLHPAFGWGMLLIIGSQVARFLVAGTPEWGRFAAWLTG
jgi:hypothetical protein